MSRAETKTNGSLGSLRTRNISKFFIMIGSAMENFGNFIKDYKNAF